MVAHVGNDGKPHIPTDENRKMVSKMSGYGVPQAMIADVVGVCLVTLKKHYSAELGQGAGKAAAAIGERLFKRAYEDGDVTALIWYTKSRMGWKAARDDEDKPADNMAAALSKLIDKLPG